MNKGTRIAFAIEQSGHTPAAMARKIGCSSAAIYQWISGETKDVRNDLLFALSDATGFNARWIATGTGPHRTADKEERRLVSIYEQLDARGKSAVMRVAEAEAVYSVNPKPPSK